MEIARFELMHGCELAIHSDEKSEAIEGIPAREPAFGIAAVWIAPENVEKARKAGYTIVDTISILGTHFGEIVRRHAHELFSRQDAKTVLDRVAEENPRLVEDLVPKLLSSGSGAESSTKPAAGASVNPRRSQAFWRR